jgi:predicted permease
VPPSGPIRSGFAIAAAAAMPYRPASSMVASILLEILGPILVMVGLGALMRWKFKLDLSTLSKLNIYLFVPAFAFERIATSSLPWSQMLGVVIVSVAHVALLGLIILGIGGMLGISRPTLFSIALAVMFYNSGNFGIPLAELAYPGDDGREGGAVQAFVVLTQNVLTYTLGLAIAAQTHSSGKGQWKTILRMPALPMLVLALLARWYTQSDPSHTLPKFIMEPARYLAAGMLPVALVTLGAQLASNPRWPRWKPVSLVLVLRLVLAPLQMAGLLYLFHLTGLATLDLWSPSRWPAEVIILTAAVPTAVNTLLLTMEVGGEADLAADCVFWTTIFSSVTVVFWLVILRSMG